MWKTSVESIDIETGEILNNLPKKILERDYELVNKTIEYKKTYKTNHKLIRNEYRSSKQLKFDFN